MDLINYTVPNFNKNKSYIPNTYMAIPYNKKRHKFGSKFIAHAHFLKGKNVFVKKCIYCCGVLKGEDYVQGRIEKERKRQLYIKEYYQKKYEHI